MVIGYYVTITFNHDISFVLFLDSDRVAGQRKLFYWFRSFSELTLGGPKQKILKKNAVFFIGLKKIKSF